MLTTDCPMCDGTATLDAALTRLTCDGCGTTAEIVAAERIALDEAA